MRDVGVNMVTISLSSSGCEKCAVNEPHFFLHPGDVVFDEVPDPKTTSRAEAAEDFREDGEPLLFRPQMMENRRCHHDVVVFSRQLRRPQVGRLRRFNIGFDRSTRAISVKVND